MKNKILMTLMALGMLVSTAFAGDTNNSPFKDNEFSVSASTSYLVDRVSPFQQDYSANVNVGIAYFPSRYLGIDAVAPIAIEGENPFSNVSVGLVARLPIGKVAPYVGLAGRYNFSDYKEKYEYVAKAGIEARLINKIGVFIEADYSNKDLNFKVGDLRATSGIRLVF